MGKVEEDRNYQKLLMHSFCSIIVNILDFKIIYSMGFN